MFVELRKHPLPVAKVGTGRARQEALQRLLVLEGRLLGFGVGLGYRIIPIVSFSSEIDKELHAPE